MNLDRIAKSQSAGGTFARMLLKAFICQGTDTLTLGGVTFTLESEGVRASVPILEWDRRAVSAHLDAIIGGVPDFCS